MPSTESLPEANHPRRPWSPRLSPGQHYAILAASSLLGVLAIFWADFARLARPAPGDHTQAINFPQSIRPPQVETEGWIIRPEGLALAAGKKASLTLTLRRRPGEKFLIDVPLLRLEDVNLSMAAQVGDQTLPFAPAMPTTDPYDLTELLEGATDFRLRVLVSDKRKEGEAELLLQNVILLEQSPLFPLPRAAYILGHFALLFLLLKSLVATASEAAVAFPFAVSGWFIMHLTVPEPMSTFTPAIFFILGAILAWHWLRTEAPSRARPAVEKLLAAAIFLLALDVRWGQLDLLRGRALDADPETYLRLANQSRFLLDTEVREPLFLFLVKAGTWLLGCQPFGLRMTTIAVSLGVVLLTWRAGREVFSPPVGLLAALFLALHHNFIFINVRGYRLELYTALCLLFFWFCFGKRSWSPRRRAIALALTGSLLCLTRINTYSSILVMLVFLFLKNRWPKSLLAVAALAPLAALAPSMVYWHQRYGDPMVAVNIHLKYYRNLEFTDHPSVPKGDEPYRGPDTNSVRYFFTEWHTPFQTLSYIMVGLYEILLGDFAWRYIYHGVSFLLVLAAVGLARWAFTPHWPMLLWLFLLAAPVAFFQRIALDFRLVFHILPLLAFSMADLLQALCAFWHWQPQLGPDVSSIELPMRKSGEPEP